MTTDPEEASPGESKGGLSLHQPGLSYQTMLSTLGDNHSNEIWKNVNRYKLV